MKPNDFLLCTFEGDTNTPPFNYVAEITDIDTFASTFNCRLVDTGQQFTFQYNMSGSWQGSDDTGATYILNTHNIYTPAATSPSPQEVALVTFADNKRYLCYVDNISPTIDVIFYHLPYRLSLDMNTIVKSDWDIYTVGGEIISIEGCTLSNNIFKPVIPLTPDVNWPPIPTFIKQYELTEKLAVFGKFKYEDNPAESNGDGIKILENWDTYNIISVPIPQLIGKINGSTENKSKYNSQNSKIRFNRKGEEALINTWQGWENAGLLDRVLTFDGGFVARYIRDTSPPNRPLSNHAWGTAFDINYAWNRLHKTPALTVQLGSVRELVAIANQNGFWWGGHFGGSRIDGMHFELGKLINS
jgi:hypothetical protein